ncbi:hypothetical protein DYBT9623_03034 [Dyadobacter sp. CECT 9623]|jgi:hypothetical protein|uniref:Outer membrane protein beta-barrel domain-containing protein n=1 Tax=Dyadobacter linearis TaxID=2823330 RepID=A0ABM8URY2_9BACT|nr:MULTISPECIES: hypothetical protein [unclassified Dyadobacter]MCE7058495.1 hypothetical protein [Dyadobacter sp. CY343]CAG5070489.1 hypothetical protein DYBT9623_03034 [Dyadobacter sp. CECT 9623]
MMRVKLLLLVSILFAQSTDIYAQRRAAKIEDSEESYKTFTSVGITTNTNSGILGGAVFRQSSALSSKLFGKNQYRYLAVEVVNVKHPKELSTQDFVTGARLVYGKENYFFVVRPEYGRELTLFNRHEDEGISISGILAAGPSLGLEKPYMVQFESDGRVVTEPFDPVKHAGSTQTQGIVGAGSFFQGFGQMKIVPGVHVKTALSFELSAFRENVTGLEIGFIAEAFSRKTRIMAFAENRSFFTSGYLTLYFGSKKR